MQTTISGHHIQVTDSLRNYVTAKLARIERHNEQVANVHVVLSVEKLRQKAEATLHVSGAETSALIWRPRPSSARVIASPGRGCAWRGCVCRVRACCG